MKTMPQDIQSLKLRKKPIQKWIFLLIKAKQTQWKSIKQLQRQVMIQKKF